MIGHCIICHLEKQVSKTPDGAYACREDYMTYNDLVGANRAAAMITQDDMADLIQPNPASHE